MYENMTNYPTWVVAEVLRRDAKLASRLRGATSEETAEKIRRRFEFGNCAVLLAPAYSVSWADDAYPEGVNWQEIADLIERVNPAAVALGRLGGAAATDAQRAAARENGKRGGRPRKTQPE